MNQCPHIDDCLHQAQQSVRDACYAYSNGLIDYHTVAWTIVNARKKTDAVFSHNCGDGKCIVATGDAGGDPTVA